MEPNKVELVDIPMPVTGDYDALVRVKPAESAAAPT
jgi:hypothetical protein